jgi:hypothetical protein
VANHGPGKSGERFCRDLDRAGSEKLIVWEHSECSTFNVQRSTLNRERVKPLKGWSDATVSLLTISPNEKQFDRPGLNRLSKAKTPLGKNIRLQR